MKQKAIRCAVIGFGYWGPHLARNIRQIDRLELAAIIEPNPIRQKFALDSHPDVQILAQISDLKSVDVDAVFIAAPAETHFELGKHAVDLGLHVFVEKPLTDSVQSANELVELANNQGVKLLVDHTFLYSPAVQAMKQASISGELGELRYFDSTRVNLGIFQPDVSVLWDLAVHDLAILYHLVEESPVAVSSSAGTHPNSPHHVAAFVTLHYSSGFFAHINVSWLSPVKIRRVVLSGEQKTVVFDDMSTDEKVKIFEAGVSSSGNELSSLLEYRLGPVTIPRLPNRETLRIELEHFRDCIMNDIEPMTSGRSAIPIIQTLEAASKSIELGGSQIRLDLYE